eukprot:NODE_1633_length_1434_cov_30.020658_g1550_i0.p1 GENE.NODE_1633_length_1434_cov_30.020658_g1550_i0~~NODE_1633_length_1434_cov_30.020658_g1550_i0.p1  ORF type:complete len:464 (+),score=103.67 NODE_1633_length_1434_cov_30.020658_g1550_i0:3-1394(+)
MGPVPPHTPTPTSPFRCVCGDDSPRAGVADIQCTQCSLFQHVACVQDEIQPPFVCCHCRHTTPPLHIATRTIPLGCKCFTKAQDLVETGHCRWGEVTALLSEHETHAGVPTSTSSSKYGQFIGRKKQYAGSARLLVIQHPTTDADVDWLGRYEFLCGVKAHARHAGCEVVSLLVDSVQQFLGTPVAVLAQQAQTDRLGVICAFWGGVPSECHAANIVPHTVYSAVMHQLQSILTKDGGQLLYPFPWVHLISSKQYLTLLSPQIPTPNTWYISPTTLQADVQALYRQPLHTVVVKTPFSFRAKSVVAKTLDAHLLDHLRQELDATRCPALVVQEPVVFCVELRVLWYYGSVAGVVYSAWDQAPTAAELRPLGMREIEEDEAESYFHNEDAAQRARLAAETYGLQALEILEHEVGGLMPFYIRTDFLAIATGDVLLCELEAEGCDHFGLISEDVMAFDLIRPLLV